MTERGRFIAFEGGEACGKSTQAARLAERLAKLGDVQLTYEPGATAVGGEIRALLLSPTTGDIDPRAEALLMAADRADHVATMVEPALASGSHVITDRYIGSSLAYQGFGRGLDVEEVRRLSVWAAGGLWPDLTVLLDVPVALAAERLGTELDRFESAGDGFHRRVADGFRTLAANEPETWVVIDGTRSVDEVGDDVIAAVRDRLGLDV